MAQYGIRGAVMRTSLPTCIAMVSLPLTSVGAPAVLLL